MASWASGLFLPALAVCGGVIAAQAAHWLEVSLEAVLDGGVVCAFRQPPAGSLACPAGLRGASVVLMAVTVGATTNMADAMAAMFFVGSLLACAWIDWRHHILPDAVVLPLLLVGLCVAASFHPLVGPADALSGGGLGLLLAVAVRRLAQRAGGGFGGGDVKLLAAIGVWLGPIGVNAVFLLAATIMLPVLLGLQRNTRNQIVPFGPALAGCSIIWAVATLAGVLPAGAIAVAMK